MTSRWGRAVQAAVVAVSVLGCSGPSAATSSPATPAVSPSAAIASAAVASAPVASPSASRSTAPAPKPSDPATGYVEVEPGRRLWLECRGSGSPTIVIDVGGDDTIRGSWGSVFGPMAEVSHVCAYDRANLGSSDPAPGPRTIADLADDLVTLLEVAKLDGPFVFVGGSFGGNITGVLAAKHPDLVAGTVFVDSDPANSDPKLDPFRSNLTKAQYRAYSEEFAPPAFDAPENTERIDWVKGLPIEVASVKHQPKVPTIVLTANQLDCPPDWPCDAIIAGEVKLQQLWIAGNAKGSQTIVDSGHVMQRQAPKAIVDAARSIVEQVRS